MRLERSNERSGLPRWVAALVALFIFIAGFVMIYLLVCLFLAVYLLFNPIVF